MKIGEKIRKIREMKGISQEAVAQSLKLTQQAYGKIERGETKLANSRLEGIAKILGVTTDNIINFEEKEIFNLISKNQESSDTKTDDSVVERLLKIMEVRFEKYEQLLEINMKLIERFLEKLRSEK